MTTEQSDRKFKDNLFRATQNAKQGNLEDAIVLLKEILDARPDHEISLGLLGAIYLQIGMHPEAIEKYEALLALNPDNPLARFQLGMAWLSRQKPQEALDIWAPMLEADNEFMANFHSGLALIQLGRKAEAVPMLDRARKHMPPSHPLYPKLLELHAQLTG